MLRKHVLLCPAGHEEDSCRTLCYITEYTTKSSFCMQTIKPYPSSDSIYLRARSVTFTPTSNLFWGERIVFHAVLFFPMCLPVAVSHSMTCQRGLEGSERTVVSFSTLGRVRIHAHVSRHLLVDEGCCQCCA